nr:uncharacterized mitochondrial protein AtMg00810-like [Tanacetum cinerariifolium]
LKEAAKFVRDFKSLAKEDDESLAKNKAMELETERLLRAVIEWLQAQLGDLKGKSKDTSCVSDTLNSLSQKLENENVELEFQVSDQKNTACGKSPNTKFAKQSILGKPPKVGETHALSKPVTSNSIPTPQGSKVVQNDKVIAPRMFKINPFKLSREEKHVPNKVRASVKTNPITVSQPPVITKKVVNSHSNGLSSTGVDNTKTRRPQPRSNTKNDRVLSASKNSRSKNKEVEVEEHHRKLLLSRYKKHMSYECNNVKLAIQNVKSKVVCAMCKKCLNSVNHDVIQICLWCVDSGCSKHMTRDLKLLINFVWKFLGTVRFRNDHVAAILGFSDLQWGNILITRVYFIEGLGHNLFSVGQFCDSNLEVSFRRNACFVKNLEGDDLLKGNHSTNLYTINLHEMASASPICLMARASSTKLWLWHQRLSHLNFDTINDLAKNDLVSGLPKFKYHKEHLCPSCEQGKSKRASHPLKPVPNSRVYNRRTKKIIETMIVSFDELSAMAFEQRSSKPGLQSMTSGQITAPRTVPATQAHQVRQTPTTSTSIADTAPPPTNSSSQATNLPNTSQDVDELNSLQQHAQQQENQALIQPETVTDNVPNAMFDANTLSIRLLLHPQDHPLEQVIGEPSRPVLTRNQLRSDGDMCMYALTVSSMEPKNVKEAMTNPAWIASMQEELLQFKRLDALYGLKQAPRALYNELSTFLLQNHFFKGTTDPTLFIRRFVNDILVVQVYVDDIIFGSTHPRYTQLFFDLMKSRFEMSMMGELMFFLGLQVNQSPCGIFLNQSNYVLEILKKYGMESCDPVGTPMEIKDKLDLDQNGTPDSVFELIGFSDADYARCKDTVKSTSGGAQFLGEKLTDYQLADIFTITLPVDRFNYLVLRLGMRSLSTQELDCLAKSHQSQRDLPRNTLLDRVEVLGSSHEVSVSTEGVEELKRIVRIKGEKKEALHTTLGRNRVAVRSSLQVPNNKCALTESRDNEIHQKSH